MTIERPRDHRHPHVVRGAPWLSGPMTGPVVAATAAQTIRAALDPKRVRQLWEEAALGHLDLVEQELRRRLP